MSQNDIVYFAFVQFIIRTLLLIFIRIWIWVGEREQPTNATIYYICCLHYDYGKTLPKIISICGEWSEWISVTYIIIHNDFRSFVLYLGRPYQCIVERKKAANYNQCIRNFCCKLHHHHYHRRVVIAINTIWVSYYNSFRILFCSHIQYCLAMTSQWHFDIYATSVFVQSQSNYE